MIRRWDTSGQYGALIYVDESDQGVWVAYKDHLTAVEELEHGLRYEIEQKEEAQEDVRFWKDQSEHWKDLYNELYDQQQL